jgi:hypothetical protein
MFRGKERNRTCRYPTMANSLQILQNPEGIFGTLIAEPSVCMFNKERKWETVDL